MNLRTRDLGYCDKGLIQRNVLLLLYCSNNKTLLFSVFYCRETLETKECSVREEEMTPMLKRSQSGSLVGPLVSQRPLSSLALMTRSWRMTSGGPSVPGRSQSLLKKACIVQMQTPKKCFCCWIGAFISMLFQSSSPTVECNGGLSEDPEVVQESGADQEVPRAEVLSEQTPGEFDFNEFFNLEKTMPGLASVRCGEHCMLVRVMVTKYLACLKGRRNRQITPKLFFLFFLGGG